MLSVACCSSTSVSCELLYFKKAMDLAMQKLSSTRIIFVADSLHK
jgi:hypothetical protein